MAKRKRSNSDKPSAQRYKLENRRRAHKIKRIAKSNGPAAVEKYLKVGKV